MSTRIAANAVPVTWSILYFPSFAELDKYHGKTLGYSREYWLKNIPLNGHMVKRVDGKKSEYTLKTDRKNSQGVGFTDQDLKAWYRFVICRPGMITEIGIDEMLKKFKISIGRK